MGRAVYTDELRATRQAAMREAIAQRKRPKVARPKVAQRPEPDKRTPGENRKFARDVAPERLLIRCANAMEREWEELVAIERDLLGPGPIGYSPISDFCS